MALIHSAKPFDVERKIDAEDTDANISSWYVCSFEKRKKHEKATV